MEDLSLHLLDIIENSIEAQARRIDVRIDEDPDRDLLVLEIRDDGKGMDEHTLQNATDPFFTTRRTRRVGLGLSMLSESAKATGEKMTIASSPGEGTRVKATFRLSHIDMKPLGDVPQTLLILIAGHPEIELRYEHIIAQQAFFLDTKEIRKEIGDLSIGSPQMLRRIDKYIRDSLNKLTKNRRG